MSRTGCFAAAIGALVAALFWLALIWIILLH
jgi:hypothetical protein